MPDYPQALLKLGRFRGTKITGDIIDNKQEHLHTFAMVREAIAWIDRTLPLSARFPKVDGVMLVPDQPVGEDQDQELGGQSERFQGSGGLLRGRRRCWRDGAFERLHHTRMLGLTRTSEALPMFLDDVAAKGKFVPGPAMPDGTTYRSRWDAGIRCTQLVVRSVEDVAPTGDQDAIAARVVAEAEPSRRRPAGHASGQKKPAKKRKRRK